MRFTVALGMCGAPLPNKADGAPPAIRVPLDTHRVLGYAALAAAVVRVIVGQWE